jgi:hypothetical protein
MPFRIGDPHQAAPFINAPSGAVLFRTEHYWQALRMTLTTCDEVDSLRPWHMPAGACRRLRLTLRATCRPGGRLVRANYDHVLPGRRRERARLRQSSRPGASPANAAGSPGCPALPGIACRAMGGYRGRPPCGGPRSWPGDASGSPGGGEGGGAFRRPMRPAESQAECAARSGTEDGPERPGQRSVRPGRAARPLPGGYLSRTERTAGTWVASLPCRVA